MIRSPGPGPNGVDGGGGQNNAGPSTHVIIPNAANEALATINNDIQNNSAACAAGHGKYKRNVLEQIRNSLKPFANASDRACSGSSQQHQHHLHQQQQQQQQYTLVPGQQALYQLANANSNQAQLPPNLLYQHYGNNNQQQQPVTNYPLYSVQQQQQLQQSPNNNSNPNVNHHQMFAAGNSNNAKIFVSNCDLSNTGTGTTNNNNNSNVDPSSLLNDINYQKHIIKHMLENRSETLINIIKDLKTSTNPINSNENQVPLVVEPANLVPPPSLKASPTNHHMVNHPIVIDQRMQQQFVHHQQQPPHPHKQLLKQKLSIPSSFASLESESGLYSGAASEKSALSSTSSVRSDSPIIVNGNNSNTNNTINQSGHHQGVSNILNLQRDRLLPDQPRIMSNNGVPIKEENNNSANRFNQLPSPYHHQVSLDSIGYSSGSSSSLCPQSQQSSNLYNVFSQSSSSVASSSSSSSAQYNRLQQQPRQPMQFTLANNVHAPSPMIPRQPKLVPNGMVMPNTVPTNNPMAGTSYHRVLSPTALVSNNPSNPSANNSNASAPTVFRPTDPLPPPPLPPHRSANAVPPPPPPPHPHSIGVTSTAEQAQPLPQGSRTNSSHGAVANGTNVSNENLAQIKNYIKNQMASNAVCSPPSSSNNMSTPTPSNSAPNFASCRQNTFNYASSASSSSPQRVASPVLFNSRFTAAPATVLNTIIGSTATVGSSVTSGIATAPTNGLISQVTQKLHNLNLNVSQQQPNMNTGSTNSLLSTYSAQSFANSPPPSYAASSSSGRQSPTLTISSSSDYASIPVLPPQRPSKVQQPQPNLCPVSNQVSVSLQNLQRKLSPIGSTSSLSINSQSSSSTNMTPKTGNSPAAPPPKHSLQAWSARQAISQSPIIMQSVKSQQVQKPVLQTAVAPTLPPLNLKISTNIGQPTATGPVSSTACLKAPPTGIATQPKLITPGGCKTPPCSSYAASNSSVSPSLSCASKSSGGGSSNQAAKNPPPYPNNCPINSKTPNTPSTRSGKTTGNFHATPPPPYSSAVHQNPNRVNVTNPSSASNPKQSSNSTPSSLESQTPTSSEVSGKSPTPPPPPKTPPPPPYSVSLTSSQNDSIAQIISGLTNSPSGTNAVSPSPSQVPTTDPPSYASSMAALAAQRAVVISPNAPPFTNQDPSTLTAETSSASTEANPNSFGSHSSNSDLVNTVESICTSQISALQSGVPRRLVLTESTGPPLPPKPSSNQQHNLAPPPPPHFPPHLQHHQLTSDVASVTSSGGSANNDYEMDSYSTEPDQSYQQYLVAASTSTSSSRENSASSTATSILNLAPHSTSTATNSTTITTSIKTNCQANCTCEQCKPCDEFCETTDGSRDVFEESDDGTKKRTHQSPIPARRSLSKAKEKERREFKVRNYSPAAFKFYMEQHVENVIKSQQQREKRREQLESEMKKACLSEEDQLGLRQMLYQKESNYIRLRRAKMDRSMFQKIKTIGVGAFGEVALVRKIDANLLYAMKTLRKDDVLKRNQVAHVKAERDILAEADCEWVVKLYYSFQDEEHLYFVMDYIPGGDLMSLLIKFGIFDEPLARFYIAELVLAVESVHKMGFIHRDIKPDNVLIDKDGHIKLTDFGLCTGFRWTHNSKYYHERGDSMDFDEARSMSDCNCKLAKPLERRKRREHQRCLAHSLVGTPNYIAPEVLVRNGYTQLCDWWSVGVILYEMVVGRPPFFANTPEDTQLKVINWKANLHIPKMVTGKMLSDEVITLIQKLCCDASGRLGKNGAEEIKRHPFFKPINFNENLREQKAPYIPEIKFDTDTSNFDPVSPDRLHSDEAEDFMMSCYNEFGEKVLDLDRTPKNKDKTERPPFGAQHPEHAFFEFTFRRFFDAIEPFKLHNDSSNNSGNGANHSSVNGGIYASTTDSTLSETASLISNGDYEDPMPDNATSLSTSDSSNTSSLPPNENNITNAKTSKSTTGNETNNISKANYQGENPEESKTSNEDEQGNNPVFV